MLRNMNEDLMVSRYPRQSFCSVWNPHFPLFVLESKTDKSKI